MTTDSKNDEGGLDEDRDQALWELLGKARATEVSPYFARRVLRDLPAGAGADVVPSGWRAWLRPGWVLGGSTAVAAVWLIIFSLSSIQVTHAPPAMVQRRAVVPVPAATVVANPAGVVAVADDVSPQDVDVIADLDNLVAREDTNVWTEDTSRF